MDTLQFVDSIAASPTVRLNLNDDTNWSAPYEGADFSPPELLRVETRSPMADGGPVAASSYANRVIRLQLDLLGSSPDDVAGRMQTLMRELDRPYNLLMWQPGTSAPVFFRTLRSQATNVRDYPGPGRLRTLNVEILAEPAAYGLEETIAGVTVSNDPAGTNGMYLDVTSVKGDLETPLHLVIANGVVGTGRRRSGLAVRRRGTPSSMPMVLQAESMTQGTDTSVQANSASMSGAGSNYSRVTFATQAGLTQRLSTATRFPSSASVDARGTYRVFARVRQNTASDSMIVRLRWGGSDVQVSNANVTLPANTLLHYVDLGLIQIPVGYDPVTRGPSGVEVATEGVFLALDARRVSGTGTLDVDVLVLMPCDDRAQFVLWPESATVTDFWLAGGPSPAAYARNASGQVTSTQAIEIAGGGLMVSPGVTNRIFFARDLGTSATAGDDVTATTLVSGSYWPRYLRPAAT